MTQDRITQAAALLQGGTYPAALPADIAPRDEDEAYAIQDAILGDAPVAAWKLAAVRLPAPLNTAPLSQDMMGESAVTGLRAPEVEVEIAIRIDADLPPRNADYTRAEVLAALGTAHAAFEVLESRFAERKAVDALSALADRASSGAVVIGSGIADWQGLDFTVLEVSLAGDGPIATARGNATLDQTVEALVWLANHASARGMGLRAGQFVITGSRIGPIAVPRGQRLRGVVEGIGEVAMVL